MIEDDPRARSRFAILSVIRAAGVVIMLLGMAVMVTGVIEPRDLIGGILFAIGFIDGLIVPQILARKWRTPPVR